MLPNLRQPGDLAPLLSLLPAGSAMAAVVELGVFAGDGTRQFLDCGRVAVIYCVDFWTAGYDPADQASGADMAEAERRFDELLSDPRVVKVKADTMSAAARVPDGLDLVYLDADHREAAVRADLAAWLPKLKPGGLAAGHDYNNDTHPGVRAAVDDILGPPDFVFPDSSWAKQLPFAGEDTK